MRTLWIQVAAVCVFLQVPGCFPACFIAGSVALCGTSTLSRVPPLPPNITHLFLQMNRIRELNATSLAGLEELRELDLGHQLVPLVIRNNAFSGQKHLRRLVLDSNRWLQLEPLAFAGLSGLQDLQLAHCKRDDSILTDGYLEPLSSLQTLNIFANKIKRLQPSMFFANLTNLTNLNLKLNNIDQICEPDLAGFKGKHFKVFNLNSVFPRAMLSNSFDWQKCGNPFRGISFETLDLSSNGFSLSQLKLFFKAIEGTKISHLKLSGHVGRSFSFNNLPDPDSSTFEGLRNSSVLSLDLSKNYVFALHPGVFSPLTEITAIDLSQNRLNQIHKKAFEGLQGHLKTLNLSHNLLGEVYSHTFAHLTNLEVLDLSHNHIGVLGSGSFIELPHLKSLNLSDNSLRQLDFPASLPSLERLELNYNKLIISPSTVNSLIRFASKVKYLNVQDNQLMNLGDVHTFLVELKRLQVLSFGGNTIKWCFINRLAGPNDVEFLDLHGSSLQSIWAQRKCLNLFDSFGNVTSLNLSFNGLRSLPQGVFRGLTSVVQMDLSSNALTYIQPDVLPRSLKSLNLSNNFIASPDPAAFSSLSSLDLSANRFHCDSDLQSFLTWLRQTNVTFLTPVREFKCEFPAGFRNVPLLNYPAGGTAVRASQNTKNKKKTF
ncbi:toll-like receptor 5 [Kryptolebias marmoratus]|uniref:Toll-like receptor 5 n=1 Tax=Kryptolebias marmoratus TaxID=37003 RepID=A0A3Q3BSR9_KRYMA|nr:toll-like receptor 5 [Kryptolebias marmoratus]